MDCTHREAGVALPAYGLRPALSHTRNSCSGSACVPPICQHSCSDDDSDDDNDEKEEIMNIATGLDDTVCQLHKQMATLQTYKRGPEDDAAEASLAL